MRSPDHITATTIRPDEGGKTRRSIRLKGYDYAQYGAYFVTICTRDRRCIFGDVTDGKMYLSSHGRVVETEWLRTGEIRRNVELDDFVVMPNHMHGIVWLSPNVGARRAVPLRQPSRALEKFGRPVPGSLPTIIRAFKSAVTKAINAKRDTLGHPVWQRNYYEHVIRDEDDLNRIRQYIDNNPARWAMDRENPHGKPDSTETEFWRQMEATASAQ